MGGGYKYCFRVFKPTATILLRHCQNRGWLAEYTFVNNGKVGDFKVFDCGHAEAIRLRWAEGAQAVGLLMGHPDWREVLGITTDDPSFDTSF